MWCLPLFSSSALHSYEGTRPPQSHPRFLSQMTITFINGLESWTVLSWILYVHTYNQHIPLTTYFITVQSKITGWLDKVGNNSLNILTLRKLVRPTINLVVPWSISDAFWQFYHSQQDSNKNYQQRTYLKNTVSLLWYSYLVISAASLLKWCIRQSLENIHHHLSFSHLWPSSSLVCVELETSRDIPYSA